MRFVMFSDQAGAVRPGVLAGETVEPLAADVASLDAFLTLDAAARRAALATRGPAVALESVVLHAPLVPRKNVFCVGRNYLAHAQEGARARGEELNLPSVPSFFTKAPTAIAGPGTTLRLDGEISVQYDWEAELAVVIGRRCAHQQWFKGKSLDGTCPLGPWIVDAEELGDPQQLDIALRVNGQTRQHSNTQAMIFSIPRIIAELSRGMTLDAGDIIATGTPDGVGFAMEPPVFLADGDVMEVEIERIGVLRNPVAIGARAAAAL